MIKRRFYKLEHGDRKDEPSDSSSSSSESEGEAESEASDEELEGEGGYGLSNENRVAGSSSSGYESADSSVNELDVDSSGLPIDEEDSETGKERHIHISGQPNMTKKKELQSADFPACVLKSKSVFKCRICPRIVCLNEDTLRAHLKSKRHARSEKLLKEGRLKATLNSDGEIDIEDTPAEPDAEIDTKSQVLGNSKKEKGGRQRPQRQRQSRKFKKKKTGNASAVTKTRPTHESPAKKRRKEEK